MLPSPATLTLGNANSSSAGNALAHASSAALPVTVFAFGGCKEASAAKPAAQLSNFLALNHTTVESNIPFSVASSAVVNCAGCWHAPASKTSETAAIPQFLDVFIAAPPCIV